MPLLARKGLGWGRPRSGISFAPPRELELSKNHGNILTDLGLSQKLAKYRRFTSAAVYSTFKNSPKSTIMTERDLEIVTRMSFVPYQVSMTRNG